MTNPPVLPALPPGACDCHMHIFDSRYPYAPGAQPIPPALPGQYRAVQKRLGTARTVVIAPSSYGLDNRCTLQGLADLGPHSRAIVCLAPTVRDEELAELHAMGVRGVRLNLARGNSTPIEDLDPIARRIAPLGWHIQVMLTPAQLAAYADKLNALQVRLVIDHLARIPQDGGISSPAYPILRKLLDGGNTWVKLSLASSARLIGTPQEDVLHAMGRALVAAAPTRLVWGSDWPHVLSTLDGTPQPGDEHMLAILLDWASSDRQRRGILCETPAMLYDFPEI